MSPNLFPKMECVECRVWSKQDFFNVDGQLLCDDCFYEVRKAGKLPPEWGKGGRPEPKPLPPEIEECLRSGIWPEVAKR
jgi:hypothetical protein